VQSVLVLGGSGLVGSTFIERWRDRFTLLAPSHAELDVLDEDRLEAALQASRADAVVNLVAWADVDGAEAQVGDQTGLAYRLNAVLPGMLARLCAAQGRHLVHISTDYVFDGTSESRPYREQDTANPLCWYALSKADGEAHIAEASTEVCIARIEMPFTARPHRKRDFARTVLARLQDGLPLVGVTDQRITPVLLDDAAEAIARVVERQVTGIVHVAATSWTTPYDFARGLARRAGLDAERVAPETFANFSRSRPARRPQHSWLDVSHAQELLGEDVLRSIDEQLDAWAAHMAFVAVGQP
jgi:dTDP-4-dehydrorhamnose reductase